MPRHVLTFSNKGLLHLFDHPLPLQYKIKNAMHSHFHLPRWFGACANYCELRKLLMRLVWSWFGFGFCNGRADEEVMKEAGMRATIAKETCSMQRVV